MNDGGTGARWCCLVCHHEHAEAACLKEEIATLTHERDEARAEVERLRGALETMVQTMEDHSVCVGSDLVERCFHCDEFMHLAAWPEHGNPKCDVGLALAKARAALAPAKAAEPPAPQPDGEKCPHGTPTTHACFACTGDVAKTLAGIPERIAEAEARVWEEAIRAAETSQVPVCVDCRETIASLLRARSQVPR